MYIYTCITDSSLGYVIIVKEHIRLTVRLVEYSYEQTGKLYACVVTLLTYEAMTHSSLYYYVYEPF